MRFVRCPAYVSFLGHASGVHRPVSRRADRNLHGGRSFASQDSNGEVDERELPEQLQGEAILLHRMILTHECPRGVSLASTGNQDVNF